MSSLSWHWRPHSCVLCHLPADTATVTNMTLTLTLPLSPSPKLSKYHGDSCHQLCQSTSCLSCGRLCPRKDRFRQGAHVIRQPMICQPPLTCYMSSVFILTSTHLLPVISLHQHPLGSQHKTRPLAPYILLVHACKLACVCVFVSMSVCLSSACVCLSMSGCRRTSSKQLS